ncbi:unnamed protein product [Pieris macdunnoughi]|uniref:Trichohyalin-plectin-homology domain-containing protein n=1 Tax=Pieris macdunnoughi TaxID=345717 RepID=A0A821L654_9NEOP|nr:unnamed protein product [Pieris macdunnoughi]
MESYEEDINSKKKVIFIFRLIGLYGVEEEENIRKFVEQTQAGVVAVWEDKKKRLEFLLAKRKKEHEEKYKDTPLSKCVHVLPCIYKLRAKETQEIQLYQMKEKEARKMAEKEFDKMWFEVAMKESDALAARMEQDDIERLRRDYECKKIHGHEYKLEQRKLQKEKEREILKEEARRFKAIWDADIRKEQEAENQRAEQRKETARERNIMIEERQETVRKQNAVANLIADTWDSLAGQGLADEKAKLMLMRRKEQELDECNKKLLEIKKQEGKSTLTRRDANILRGRRKLIGKYVKLWWNK